MRLSEVRVGDTLIPQPGCRSCLVAGRRYSVRMGRGEWQADLLCLECEIGEHFLYEDLDDGELKNFTHFPIPRLVTTRK